MLKSPAVFIGYGILDLVGLFLLTKGCGSNEAKMVTSPSGEQLVLAGRGLARFQHGKSCIPGNPSVLG